MRKYNGKEYIEKQKHDIIELVEIVDILRSPNGCEWDRAQDFNSMKKCLSDETEEVLQAIDKKDYKNLQEELGDVLLQVVMNSQIAKEQGLFDFSDVIQTLSEKLIRRHPHVFGDEPRPTTPEESLALWKKVKKIEKALIENNKTEEKGEKL
ncbi:MAG: nucleotide pyrophosphohydrolase [Clostridiales bacterium]|nr:nucleotide pyrophosphohydrolase [Clostridiales bacterium]